MITITPLFVFILFAFLLFFSKKLRFWVWTIACAIGLSMLPGMTRNPEATWAAAAGVLIFVWVLFIAVGWVYRQEKKSQPRPVAHPRAPKRFGKFRPR